MTATATSTGPVAAETERASSATRAPTLLTTAPRPSPDSTVAPLASVIAGGLEAVQAEWGLEGGAVVLTGQRPFVDLTGRAGFRPDGSLDGSVQMRAAVKMLGLPLGEAAWTIAGWTPEVPLSAPSVHLRGTTLHVDLAGLPREAVFTPAPSLPATVDGTAISLELPADATPAGEPLSPRYAELFRGLLGVDVGGISVHADAPVAGAPAFVSNEDLFFAPGIYGVDSPETLRILDAAVRAALAGVFGTIGATEAPPPTPPPEPGEPAPAADTTVVNANLPASTGTVTPTPDATVPAADAPATGATAQDAGAELAPPDADVAPGEGGSDAAPAPVVEVLMPEAPTAPTPAAAARGAAVAGGAGGAARAASTLPTADEDTTDARGAVAEPAAETAARAQEAVAAELGAAPPPSPEIVALTERIRTAIRENRPEDEDDLIKTDPTQQAQNAGATISGSVETQSTQVSGAYDAMATPPSGTPALTPVPVVAPDASSPGMGVSAASAAPDPSPPEDTSLDADVAATDQRIADSNMETRVTAEIPDGPFAAQRQARGELGELAERTPAEIQAEEQGSIDTAQADMAQLQLQAVASLHAARAHTVADTTGASGAMTGNEVTTRENVSQRAQGIYDAAQHDVTAMLTPLTRTAMARWEAELARHSREFHDALDAVQRWIDDRHSGVLGTLVAIGDYVGGLPAWVTVEYNRAERAFGDGVCDTLLSISSDVNAVIAAAQARISQARDDINELFDQMEAEFPEFVAAERARFGGMLDGLSAQVNDAQTSFVRDVSNAAITAVNEAHATVQAKREEAGGLIGRVVAAIEEFIDDPVRAIINGLLRLVGIPPAAFWSLVSQIEQVISDIADDPENFINNLVEGVKQGFQQFFDNFGTHLIEAFWGWLFSGLKTPIPMPTAFDAISLVTFALQLMGITWPNVREILVRHIGPEAVELLEIAWQIISVLINEGPQGLVNMVKEQLSPENIVGMIVQAAVDYVVEKLIAKAVEWVFSLLNPAGAVAQAIMLIYRVLSWIFHNAARIFAFVQAVVGGMADVIAGNVGGLANTVERALGMMLIVVIDLFAGLLGLGDLPDEVAEVIERMQAYILGIIDRIVGFLVTQARALLRRLGVGGEEHPDDAHPNDDGELGKTVRFRAGGESHRLYVQASGSDAEIMLASTPAPVTAKIREWRAMARDNPEKVVSGTPEEALGKIATLEANVAALKAEASQLAPGFAAAAASTDHSVQPPSDSGVESKETEVAHQLDELYGIFGQQDERAIVQAIRAVMPNIVTEFLADADTQLSGPLADVTYVARDSEVAAPLFANRDAAKNAGTTVGERIGSDANVHMRLVAWFREPVRPATAATSAEFAAAALTFGPERTRAGQLARKAFGDAYVDVLKAGATAAADPVDEWTLGQVEHMRWRASGGTYGMITRPPQPLERTDPALQRRASGRVVPFLRTMATASAVEDYRFARFKWAWTHSQSHRYFTGAFRQAELGGQRGNYHEWIPTSMIPQLLEHAIGDTAVSDSGVRQSVQWVNVHHYLRSDTTLVFYTVDPGRRPSPTASRGTRQMVNVQVGTHSGSAYDDATGDSGGGTIGQSDFHDALRTAFPTNYGTAPPAFVEALAGVVDGLLWNGQTIPPGVSPDAWDEPLELWFRIIGSGDRESGLTLRRLSARQRDNFLKIGNDFLNTLANIDQM